MVTIPAYKDKQRGTWYASFYYTDWQGHRRLKKKRGFATRREARAFEDEFLKQGTQSCDMTFGSLVELYLPDMEHRLKPTTMQNKRYLIEKRMLPFFKDLPVNQITPAHVRRWQSGLLAEKLSPTYVKTINNQLAAIFNYATKYYGLAMSPARLAGSVGKKQAQEMHFWTVDEFKTFIPNVPKLPARTGLSILFWTGLRISELLSLRADDIDLEARTLTVNKGFQRRSRGRSSSWTRRLPGAAGSSRCRRALCDEIKTYLDALYEPQPGDRLFPYTKSYFHRQMQLGCDAAGMEKIRLHDLRHSHAALLIRLGTPILLVSERLGH